jgi:hypothetical protein
LTDSVGLVDRHLDASDTRLLAVRVGERIPHEVLANFDALRAERGRLLAQNAAS